MKVFVLSNEKEMHFREYREGDEQKIIDLLELSFGRWPNFDLPFSPLEHWKWKYVDCPIKTPVKGLDIVELDNQIIGYSSRSLRKTKIGDDIVLSASGGDLAVHPNFRGRGISVKMLKVITENRKTGIEFMFAATRNPLLIKGRRHAQIMKVFPFNVKYLARIKDIGLHLKVIGSENYWIKKLGLHTMKIINSLSYIPRKIKVRQRNFLISIVDTFDERINTFWEDIKDHYDFIVYRSSEYLNWRYCDPRAGNYLIKIAEDDNSILGYIVYRINRLNEDYPRGYIVDLLCSPNRLDVAEILMMEAISYFDEQNVNIVSIWIVKNHPYESMVKKHGFVDIGTSPHLYYPPTELNFDELSSAPVKRLHFCYGDVDWI